MSLVWVGGPAQAFSWGTQVVDSAGIVGSWTGIAVDSAAKVHVSYYDSTNGDLKYASSTGGPWTIERVDTVGNVGSDSSIAIDSSNKPHVSYRDNTNGDLKYAKRPGAVWIPEVVDSNGDAGYGSSVDLDSSNRPHISYWSTGSPAGLKYARWDAVAWVVETVRAGPVPLGIRTEATGIVLDSSNVPHISFYDPVGGDLLYARKSAGWVIETVDSSGDVGWSSSIALDSSGRPHIAYFAWTQGELRHAKKPASVWQVETVDTPGFTIYGTSIALDASDRPHISYHYRTTEDLRYARWTGATWSIETVDSAGVVGLYSDIALDGCAKAHISYWDQTNADLKYTRASDGGPNQLILEKGHEWYVTSDTQASSVVAGDVDDDGTMEVVTAGIRNALYGGQAELRVWRWWQCSLVLEADKAWPVSGPLGSGNVARSVAVGNTDGDPQTEIVTAGSTIRGGVAGWDVRVWRSDGSTIVQEAELAFPVGQGTAYSVHLQNTDGDTYPEIFVTGTIASGSGGYYGLVQAWEWTPNPFPGQYLQRDEEFWGTATVVTEGHGVSAGELNWPVSSPPEVVVGGFTTTGGQKRAQLNLWTWNGVSFGTRSVTEWGELGGDTAVNSTHVGNVGGDGQLEILTAGNAWVASETKSQLRVWHWTGTFIDRKVDQLWIDGTGSNANSVFARNVDRDADVEILAAGEADLGTICNGQPASMTYAQLVIFNWDGAAIQLNEEKRESWVVGGVCPDSAQAFGVYALDVDTDGVVEILTAGRDFDSVLGIRIGQLRIWNWNLP